MRREPQQPSWEQQRASNNKGKNRFVAGCDALDPEEQRDPWGPSYPESAARHLWCRAIFACSAIFLVIIGTASLPEDAVRCIEDEAIDVLRPITDYYSQNLLLGVTFMTIMQLVVDFQLIAMPLLWYFQGQSFRYAIALAFLGINKIFLNLIFQVRPISGSFEERILPSLVFGSNFQNTYFFSGVMAFMLINFLELKATNHETLMKIQIAVVVYCFFMLLTMRQNFFMDVVTGLVFGHIVFTFIDERREKIDQKLVSCIEGDERP